MLESRCTWSGWIHPPTQEATAVKLWRNAQWVSSEALAKEDTLRRVPPKTQEGPRLLSRGAPLVTMRWRLCPLVL